MSAVWRQRAEEALSAMPLVVALRHRGHRSRGTRLLLALLTLYAAVAVLVPHVEALQRRILESFHFRPPSTLSWVALQPLPKMYGCANRVWIGPKPTLHSFEHHALWVNHYPARYARFDGGRRAAFEDANTTYDFYIRSRYRSLTAWSAYRMRFDGKNVQLTPIEALGE